MVIKTNLKEPYWEILEGRESIRCDGCGKTMGKDEDFYGLQGWMPIVFFNNYFCEDCYPKHKEECCCDECDAKWQTRAKYVVRTKEFDEDSNTMKWAKKVLGMTNQKDDDLHRNMDVSQLIEKAKKLEK